MFFRFCIWASMCLLGLSLVSCGPRPADPPHHVPAPARETAPAAGARETAPAAGARETAPAAGARETAPAAGARETAPAAPRRVVPHKPVTTLDAVARCFHRAVTLLQAEPVAGESLSTFFSRAMKRATGPRDGCLAGLRRDSSGAVVVMAKDRGNPTGSGVTDHPPDGAVVPVSVTRGASSHSSFEGGISELAIPYHFTAPGFTDAVTITIVLELGGRR